MLFLNLIGFVQNGLQINYKMVAQSLTIVTNNCLKIFFST